jgi:hypothetical protein
LNKKEKTENGFLKVTIECFFLKYIKSVNIYNNLFTPQSPQCLSFLFDYFLDLSISLRNRKENNNDFNSNGEWNWNKKNKILNQSF